MIHAIKIISLSALLAFNLDGTAYASDPVCASDKAPYRDLDFLAGNWEFFTLDGKKIGDQIYQKKEAGCLILEDWKTLWGETGTGMNFVDPKTKQWRQVWMSPSYHIDYSGGLTESGSFILEGIMYTNATQESSAVRGVYSRQADGSVIKEFLKFDNHTKEWKQFFIGVARKPGSHSNPDK